MQNFVLFAMLFAQATWADGQQLRSKVANVEVKITHPLVVDTATKKATHKPCVETQVGIITGNAVEKTHLVRRVYKTFPTDGFQEFDVFHTSDEGVFGPTVMGRQDRLDMWFPDEKTLASLKGVRVFGRGGDYVEVKLTR